MNYKMVLYLLGRILIIMAMLMCLPLSIALVQKEDPSLGFLVAIGVALVFGLIFGVKKPADTTLYAKEGVVVVGAGWLVTSILGALPFYIGSEIPSFVNAFFETVSGFTTTGASVVNNIEGMSHSALFWRSFTQWIGGMGVLVFVLAITPKSEKSQSIHIMRAESPGPQVGKLVSRMRNTARILYGIYISLTALEVVCLIMTGMPLFDSLLTSFSTAGTGGFSVKNASIAAYDSAVVDWIIALFMTLFGINFSLFYLILTGNILQALKSEELHWYLGIVSVAGLLIASNILPLYENFLEALRYAFFQVTSIMTTTGFITADYEQWPVFSQTILIILMFIGACAGSTGGGIKVSRLLILIKSSMRELRQQLRPRSVTAISLENKPVDARVVSGVMAYMSIYAFTFVIAQLLLSLDKFSYVTNLSAVITCINNIGPGLDAVGPVHNFYAYSTLSKVVLSITMLAGRLELMPIVLLFAPSTWRRR
ncbi:MAG: TrkH family potassium uptake protein [Ruminococcaceae bacterium]|nr:TrkH family potassium uptake protein [Oscillospiraceae bacterium]